MGIAGVELTLEQLWDLLPEEVTVPVLIGTAAVATLVTVAVVACRSPTPVLVAHVVSLHVRGTLPLSTDHGATQALGPHWSENAADRAIPAAVAIDGPLTIDVLVTVTRSDHCPATTRLEGHSGTFIFGADGCPTTVGTHPVRVTIADASDHLARDIDTTDWTLALGGGVTGIGQTRHHLYFLFGDSARQRGGHSAYHAGVWLEILDWLFDHTGIDGLDTEADAASAITTYCHGHGPAYASVGHYELDIHPSQDYPGKLFRLQDYLDRRLPAVNCADQAQAVTSLCHALGIDMQIGTLDPFGYILPTHIVGIEGLCNNPKPAIEEEHELDHHVVSADHCLSNLRWGFSRHVFCVLGTIEPTGETVQIGMMLTPGARLSEGSTVYDACAGPHLGMGLDAYLDASIDTEAHEFRIIARKGDSDRAPKDPARAEHLRGEGPLFGLRVACPVCDSDDLDEVSRRYIDYQNIDELRYRCRTCDEDFRIGETRKG